MSLSSQFESSMAEHSASFLAQFLADRPRLTVGDLRELIREYPGLGDITLQEALNLAGARTNGVKRGVKSASGTKAKKTWNVRTEEGRAELDEAVLAAIQERGAEEGVLAEHLRDIGASPAQLRTSIARLIEAGSVTWTGKARGTRYWPS